MVRFDWKLNMQEGMRLLKGDQVRRWGTRQGNEQHREPGDPGQMLALPRLTQVTVECPFPGKFPSSKTWWPKLGERL